MNLLITGAWNGAAEYIQQIEQQGHFVRFMQYENDKLPCDCEWVEGVICNGLFLTHSIEKFVNLKYIQLTSAGYDRTPMDYVKTHNIKIYNARGVYSIPMAEFAVGGVLQLYKKAAFFYENKKRHSWEKRRDLPELCKKTVCILGCGSVGTECAKRFQAFDCKVIGVDLFISSNPYYDKILAFDELNKVLPEADVLVLTLPLTDDTEHMINAACFEVLKPGALLVNIARGAIVDSKALIDALHHNLGGAVLDVFEEEPLSEDNPLWDMENVIITPHNSFVGDGNKSRLNAVIMGNLERN